MAHMYPKGGPAHTTRSDAERMVYFVLQKYLDNNYYVFHSVALQIFSDKARALDREVDFVILHPLRGVIVLEVKGGIITRDSATGIWYSTNKGGERIVIKDPLYQVKLERNILNKYLKSNICTRAIADKFRMREVIWFPDCELPEVRLPNIFSDCVLDSNNVANPVHALERAYDCIDLKKLQEPLSEDHIKSFCEALSPSITLQSCTNQMNNSLKNITQLTVEQVKIFNKMIDNRRLFIPGAAGTGKTVIAYEFAWRLAKKGNRVLLLTHQEFQRKFLKNKWDDSNKVDKPVFDIHDIKSLAIALAEMVSISSQEIAQLRMSLTKDQEKLGLFLEQCLQLLYKKPEIHWQYDAIFIDEAQDILTSIQLKTEQLLRQRKTSRFYVFYDAAQRVDFEQEEEDASGQELLALPLTDNCRNTGVIYTLMQQYNPTIKNTIFRGEEGVPVAYFSPDIYKDYGATEEIATYKALKAALERLTLLDKVAYQNILIITCRSAEKSNWKHWRNEKEYPIRALFQKDLTGNIRLATIRSAKGLESMAVILIELDGLRATSFRDKLLYIGVSRAQLRLVVIGNKEDIYTYEELKKLPKKSQ